MGEGKRKRVYSGVVTSIHALCYWYVPSFLAEMNKYEQELASESEDVPKEPVLI